MAHLLSCRLLGDACTDDDLARVTERAKACARNWEKLNERHERRRILAQVSVALDERGRVRRIILNRRPDPSQTLSEKTISGQGQKAILSCHTSREDSKQHPRTFENAQVLFLGGTAIVQYTLSDKGNIFDDIFDYYVRDIPPLTFAWRC